MRKILFVFSFALFSILFVFSQEDKGIKTDKVDSMLTIHTTRDSIRLDKIETALACLPRVYSIIKTDFEWNTETGKKRFILRNARLGVKGNLSPLINYNAEMDLSDEGVFRVLQAHATFKPYRSDNHNLSFQVGYQKPAFSSEYLRTPMGIFFIKKSLVVNEITASMVDVGVVANYAFKNNILPFELSVGVMNGMGFKNRTFTVPNYTGRLKLIPYEGLSLIAEYYGGNTADTNRVDIWGFECAYQNDNFLIEAEYLHRQTEYVDLLMIKKRNGLLVQSYYKFPLKNAGVLHYIAPSLRWDMLGNSIFTEKLQFARLTAGVNFGIDKTFLKAEFRLNYEKYFKAISLEGNDLFLAEFIISI